MSLLRPLARPLPRSIAPSLSRGLLAAAVLSTLAACQPRIRLSDSVDQDFDLRPAHAYDDHLHPPYVAGSSFTIYVYDDENDHSLEGWTLRTNVPGIIDIYEQYIDRDDVEEHDKSKSESDVLVAKVTAIGTGPVVLEVYDESDHYVRGVEVEVMQPDRAELRAAGPLFIHDEDRVSSEVDASPKVIADGTATFLVEWYAGDERLHGSGALSLYSDSPDVVDLWARESVLDEDRDWLTITTASVLADPAEISLVDLSANGQLVQTVEFSVVGDAEVAEVGLIGRSESGADDGDWLVVLAQAFDGNGESIWGVAFDWDLDGVPEPGEGDLFRYKFEKHRWSSLAAEYAGMRAETDIQGVEGYVDSSNDISCFCSARPEQGGRHIGFGLLVLAGLGLVRRRG